MITEVQENKITDYLVAQELSLDILVEIRDHMMSQISDIQFNENISFEEAFLKVKESWNGEFTMVNYLLFYPTKIPFIAKRIIQEKYSGLFKKSLMVGALAFAVNLLLIFMAANQEVYKILFRLLNGSFVLTTLLIWIFNYKIWKYIKADFKYRGKCLYTMYQQNLGLMVIGASSMTQVTLKSGDYAYQFFRQQNYTDVVGVLMTLILPFVLQVALSFAVFNFLEHKKNLIKMQEFLKPA
ncbi:hypothetical protein WH221_12820 [Chryseobacterium culicis]|uniref:Uncharacterized protein n=1 Tax=Chryseobacterium culicis TaxID=680127 RepID=A0A2S9D2T0_CHRCI|nr:hypothetical protein [Chryseobacterium culicis]PRB87078.1 hypothetical protein CQ022_12800 [Chryseobacterium culicis]PRB92831.1 hypothetical protein CQ033_06470 [Chryseobacterium culicis]